MSFDNFDATSFLMTQLEGANDTKLIPIPEGEYIFQVSTKENALKVAHGKSKESGKPWVRVDLICEILDPAGALKEQIKREPQIRHGIMLELTESGKLDMSPGANVRLGQFRQACGYNESGDWSWAGFRGKQFKARVGHRVTDDGTTVAEIKQFLLNA